MKNNFTSSFFKLLTICVVSLLFINNGFTQEQSDKESDDWPKTAKLSKKELNDYMEVLKKRANIYNENKSFSSYSQRSSETNPVGTCNIITCGSFNAMDITPNNNGLPPEFQTAVDGSTYSADVVYDCWNDEGTVDYSEGQYISYSNIDANIDTPAIISPSPDGGGFSIFSYKFEGIEQDLEVLPNATYRVCFEIAVIPRYSNSNGSFVEFSPDLHFGIGSGGIQITDPLTYNESNLTVHPLSDFPNSLSTATTGPFQNSGGWTEINPYWETICITFQSDNSGTVNVFYQTQTPGKSVVLVDGLRLSLEGYAVPPTIAEENIDTGDNATDVFCDSFSVDLNSYITSTGPGGSELTWSTNPDPLNTSGHLADTVVSTPGTYYVFYYNPDDLCASPAGSINLMISDLDASVDSKSNADCVGDSNGSVTISAINGNPPYSYAIDGGSSQTSNSFNDLNIGAHFVEVTDSNNCSESVYFNIIANDTEAPTASNLDPISVQCIDDVPEYDIEDVDDEADNVTTNPVVAFVSDVSNNSSCPETITRTYSVTDDCGNSINVTQLITVNDTIPPTIDTPASEIIIECGVTPAGTLQNWLDTNGGAMASDNCGNVTWSNNYNTGVSDCSESTTVIFTATDHCGNTATTRATYVIQDTTPPVITNPASDQSIECNATQNVQTWLDTNGGATATDDCSAIIWSNNFTSLSGGCGETGSATVTFTATDGCGNSTSTTATFNSIDTTNPVAPSAPADLNLQCIDEVPNPGQLTASDNCMSNITVTGVDDINNSNPCRVTILRTWTFIDDCGNSSSVSQSIIVTDTTAPTFTVPANLNIECGVDANNLSITGDVTDEKDNCSSGLNATYTDSVANGSCTNTETITRTWSLTDDCNNTTRHVQIINVVDTTAPTLTIPSNVTVACTDPTDPSATGTATGSDSCGNVTISYNDTSYANCGNTKKIKRIWTATDDCGNTRSRNQIITVKDTTPPTIDTPASPIMIECGVTPDGTLQAWLDNNGGATASDSCGNVTWSNDYNDGVSDCSASTTVTFTATDDCGNVATTSATYSIQDTTSPVITIAASDQTIECNTDSNATQSIQSWLASNGGATATDDCSSVIWSNDFTSLSGGCGETGSATVTFTATDGCGNSTSTTATFNNSDSTNPVAPSAPNDLTFQCIDEVPNPGQLTATDNCMNNITVTGVDSVDNSNPCHITIVRTWTFIDDCGNSSSVSQNIVVADTTAPTFTVPEDITIQCGEDTSSANTGDVTDEKDNCSSGLQATYTDSVANGSCSSSETITRTWSLTDDCNNTKTLVQTINVVDTTAPTLIIPSDVTIECTNPTDPSATGTATASDSCNNVTVSYSETSDNNCGNTETITRTWTATDDCGNTTSLDQIITIEDTTPPTMDTSASNIMIECGVTPSGTLQTWLDNNGGAVASDNCGSVTWTNNYSDGVSDCSSSTTVIFTATDDCGNTSTTSAAYTIQDTTPPVITNAASDKTIECNIDSSSTQSIQNWLDTNGGAIATDDCSTVIWSNNFTSLSGGCGETGSATVTFTATDGCGNSTSTTATFNNSDSTNPVAPNAPDDLTFQCIDEVPSPGQLTATDNCMSNITATGIDNIDNSNPCHITIVRTWTFIDDCGNSSSVSQNITVADTIAPTFTVPADLNIECGVDANDLSITGDVTNKKDNCSSGINATYTDSVSNGSCTNTEIITRTWSLTDDCNNTTRHVQTINVIDTTAPTFTVPANVTIECDDDETDLTLTGDVTDEADNCSIDLEATYTDTITDGSCANETVIKRTWSLTDGCNNTTTLVQSITVQDTTAPIIDNIRIKNIAIQCGVSPDGTLQNWLDNNAGATATDSCGNVTWSNDFAMNTNVDCANGAITVIFTATDDCGNTATTSATYAIQDTTPPVITNPASDQSIECNIDGGVTEDIITWLATNGGATATDDCSAVTWSHNYTSLSDGCGETGSATVTFTATDGCGNSTSTTATFNSIDTTNPVAPSAPADLTFQCIDEVPNPGQLTANDNCMDNITVTGVDVIDNSDPCHITIVRTWTFIDDCGNSSSVSQNITVVDTTAPTITVPADITIQCGVDESSANTGEATGSDNCSDLTITYSDTDTSACGNTKTITRTWTVTDGCNNSVSDTQIINVIDTTDPSFNESLPTNITVDSNNIPTASVITASDNCDDNVDVIFSETLIGSNCDASYTIERNWSAEDDCGNDIEHTQIINVNHTVLSINVSSKIDVNCFGQATGAIDINVTGGLPPYSYSWSNGSTSQDLTDIGVGNYTITVEDNNGCTVYKSIYIEEPANPLNLTINKVNATSIQGCTDGTATATVSGGTAPYTYEWSASANNQTTATASNLPVGNHSVVVIDANGCKTVKSIEITCTDDCDTALTTGTTTNVLCFGDATGATSVSASSVINPTATFTFTWSNGQTDAGVTSSTIEDVIAGNYTVSVTMDGSVCDPVEQTINIAQPNEALSATLNKVDATSIQGCTDGTATATVSGGTAPYTYEWSASANNQTTATASNLPVGNHSVVVIDANGCKTVESIVIACTDDCDTALTTGTTTNVLCFGDATGATSVSASSVINPTATFTFTWSNGQTDTGVTSSTIEDVIAGNYTVSVTMDGSVCDPVEQTINIAQPNEALSATLNKVNATSIQGCTDGTATAIVSGGTAPYTYLWSASANNQTSATANNLPVGNHSVVVTDDNNCTTTLSIEITCTDDCDTALTTGTTTNVLCFGDATGTTSVSASSVINPTATFTFTWSNGQTDTGVTSSTIEDVIAGNYTVSVTMDGSVCDPVEQTINIAQPNEALSATLNKVNATSIQGCTDGTATAIVSGGTAPYTYLWSASANNQTSATANNLPVGNHSVVVTDDNNCTTTLSIEITCTDDCDTALTTGTTTNVLCFGDATGATSVSASSVINPTATFTFTWSNGQTDTGVTSSTIEDLIAGNYTVSVTMDGSVCDPVVQTINIAQPNEALSLTINKVNATSIQGCTDGTATAIVSGGTAPYTYLWSASANNQTSATANNLPVGNHSVVVTDDNNCTTTLSIEITCTDDCDTALTTGTTTNVLCFGDATGATSVSASSVINPTATFTFTWSNGQTDTGVTSSTIEDLIAGNYTVSVTMDGSVCDPVVQTINIAQPNEALSLTINKVNATSIQGCTDGTATAIVSGGTAPYTYLWSASANNQTSATANNLPVGNHSVVVTDDNNCTTTLSIEITCTDDCDTALTTGTTTNVLCFGDATGATSVSASSVINPTATFTFTWSNGQTDTGVTSSTIEDLIAGNYTVSVTMDGSVCDPVVQTINIAQPNEALSLTINKVNATSIQGCTDGTATAIVSGGTAPYTYLWSASANNQTTVTATDLPIGNHSVIVTDANNCTTTLSIEITCTDDCDTAITVETTTNVLCFGDATGATSVSASSVINPTATFTFTWSNGQTDTGVTSSTIEDLIAGNYTVSVTMDESVCDPVVQSITISEPSESLSASITTQTDIVCVGLGEVTITGTGGTAPYLYSIDNGSSYETDGTFTNLSAGSYSIVVLDANNCKTLIATHILINCTYAIADINNTFVDLAVSGNVLTNDEDLEGDNQTVTANTDPANGTVIMNPNGSYTYTPNPGFIGEDTFEYTICDDGNPQACDTATVYIEVLPESGPENEAPIANADTATTPEGTPINIVVLANDFDPDADPITITGTTDPANGTVTLNPNGTITYTPNPGFIGEDTFTYTICDDGNPQLCDTATVTVTVQPSSTPNTTNANDDAYNVTPTSVLIGNVLLNDNDIEGDTQIVTSTTVTTTQGVTVNIDPNTGEFTYTPNAGFSGTDSFIYSICDNGNPIACDEATVYITVEGVAGMSIIKSAYTASTDCVSAGDSVTYIFTVTNSGDLLINSITIIDDLLGGDITASLTLVGDTNNDDILDPTETWVFTALDYIITQANVDAGNITNNVTANGLEPDGTTTVQATDTYVIDANNTEVTLCNESGINLVKTGVFNNENGNDCTEIDETITYTFTVTNSGDIALDNVIITDPLLDNAVPQVSINFVSGDTDGDNQLDPSESWLYSATYLVTQIDIDATEVTNSATVTATEVVNGTSISAISQTTTELIEDTTPPDTSNCAVLDETIECNGTDNETIANNWNTANITALEACATDACDNNFIVTSDYDFGNLVSDCGASGTITVIYTLTDATGNASTFTATITLEDTTGPDLSACTDLDETIECSGTDTETLANNWNTTNITALETCGSDTCDVIPTNSVTSDYDFTNLVSTCGSGGTITVIYTVADDCGNTSTLTATLTIEDTTPPTFSVPDDITIECDVDATDVTLTGDVTDESDNCSTGLDAIFTDNVADGSCPSESIITRTWSLTDACDNTTTFVQTITVKDTTPPTFSVPADITIECDEDATDLILTGDVTDEADNCSTGLNAIFTDSFGDGSCPSASIITRTWSLTDECDNTTTFVQTITIQDTTPPTIDNSDSENIEIECGITPDGTLDAWLANNAGATATDNCGTVTWTNDFNSNTDTDCDNGAITVTFTATDDCGNTATTTATYAIIDTVAPVLMIPLAVTIECDESTDPSNTGLAKAIDDCAEAEVTYIDTEVATCGNTKTITRTWTATDACGNSVSDVQIITVEDSTAPTFTVPEDITIECDVDATDVTLTGDVTDEADNCSIDIEAIFTDSVADGSCPNASIITRTWSLTDDCDNTTTFVQTITIQDTTAPTFTVPADITIECDMDATDITVTGDVTDEADNCSIGLNATFTDSVADGTCPSNSIITRTWSLTDDCDNTTTFVQTITVQDTTAPTFTVPADITIECDVDATDITITGDVTDEADNCSTGLDAIFTDSVAEGSCPSASIITRTWSLTDDCDNTTTFVQTITVQDTTAPTFTVPADLTIECDVDVTDLTLVGDVIDETDNCSIGLEAVFTDSIEDGICSGAFIITRTWSLTDDCDNTTSFNQTITVQDTTAPTFTVPEDITIECDVDATDVTLTGDVTDEADNCSAGIEAVFTDSSADGSCPNESVITRTWSLTDDCDNTTTFVQTITIQDTTAPSFNESLPADINAECDNVPDAETLTAIDNCGTTEVTFEEEISNGACIGDYIIVRTWIATDSCGNEAVHTQIITVQDTTAPTLTSPLDTTLTVTCDDVPEVPNLAFEDSCSNNIDVDFYEESTQANNFDDYNIIRTWTVTDDCGNTAVFTQNITVEITNVINAFDTSRCVLDEEFDLFDLLSGDFSMDGTWSVVSGNATIDGSLFNPSAAEVGVYTFMYAITEGPCPTEKEVNVTLDDDCVVLACGEEDVVISKTVTANGDAYNEFFTITGIEDCEFVVELQIFNRWGAEIYKSSNYKNDWNGNAHGSSVGNSGKVPTGTYYYIINLRDSGLKPFAGPIYVATN